MLKIVCQLFLFSLTAGQDQLNERGEEKQNNKKTRNDIFIYYTRLMLTYANQLGKYCVRKTKVHFTDTVQTVSSISHAVTKILTILDLNKKRLRLISKIDIRHGDFYFWIITIRQERRCCYYLCKIYN